MMTAQMQAAEKAAREAYAVETEAEDASRLADGALHPLVEGVAELKETMKLRLRWACSILKACGSSR